MVSLDCRKASLIVGLVLVVGFDQASAQQPSPAQVNAIRQSCRSDFMSNCSGVQPGGKDAIECLERNLSKLSVPCKTAVSAVAPKPPAPAATVNPAPAPAAANPQPTPSASTATPATVSASQQEQVRAIQEACTLSDFTAHCSWIKPDSPEVLLCLQANAAQLSPNCQTAVRGLPASAVPAPSANAPAAPAAMPTALPPPPTRTPQQAARPVAPRLPAAAAAAPAATAATAARQPTPEQLSAIRSACRSDFMSHCSGVQPGGVEALQCLERNSAQLSAPCGTAVSAIAKGGATAPSAAATATAPTATAAPAAMPFVPRRLRLIEEMAILRACGGDQRTFCAGVPPGGGRIVECLAKNASSLSPGCSGALAQARP